MSVYLMLTTLTDQGRQAIQEDPDRLREINKEVEFMGLKSSTSTPFWDSMTSLIYLKRQTMKSWLDWQYDSVAKERCKP